MVNMNFFFIVGLFIFDIDKIMFFINDLQSTKYLFQEYFH